MNLPPPPPPKTTSSPVGVSALLIAAGLWAVAGAVFWWLSSKPSRAEEIAALTLGRVAPQATTAGPIILAVAGAFMILLGVILYSGKSR